MRKALAIVLVFALGIALGLVLPPNIQLYSMVKAKYDMPSTGIIFPVLYLKVYDKDGNLLWSYRKIGDPPTANFLKWILFSWFYRTEETVTLYNKTWTDKDGDSASPGDEQVHGGIWGWVGDRRATLKIGLGNGTAPPSINDYKLENELVGIPVTWGSFDANSTHMWIEVRATYTAPSPITITEIGLFGRMNGGYYHSASWFLLFRDVIPPISLDKDQTLEIRYYVYVRYG